MTNTGVRDLAQLIEWNGNSLALDILTNWYWFGNTTINSIALRDVDGNLQAEFVTGGRYFDGSRNVAQLIEWRGSNLAIDRLTSGYWTNKTAINSVIAFDTNFDMSKEITGGSLVIALTFAIYLSNAEVSSSKTTKG